MLELRTPGLHDLMNSTVDLCHGHGIWDYCINQPFKYQVKLLFLLIIIVNTSLLYYTYRISASFAVNWPLSMMNLHRHSLY